MKTFLMLVVLNTVGSVMTVGVIDVIALHHDYSPEIKTARDLLHDGWTSPENYAAFHKAACVGTSAMPIYFYSKAAMAGLNEKAVKELCDHVRTQIVKQ